MSRFISAEELNELKVFCEGIFFTWFFMSAWIKFNKPKCFLITGMTIHSRTQVISLNQHGGSPWLKKQLQNLQLPKNLHQQNLLRSQWLRKL